MKNPFEVYKGIKAYEEVRLNDVPFGAVAAAGM